MQSINNSRMQNPYMYGILGIRNNQINTGLCFDAKLFDCLDESLCARALLATGIDKELARNGVAAKTLKEYFTGIGGDESGTCRGKDERFFIEYKANKIDENNYIFTVTYKTPKSELKISYNTKDKITAAENWADNDPILKASSKFCRKDNAVEEEIFWYPRGADNGYICRQKYRKAQKDYPLTQEGTLFGYHGGYALKIFCDYGEGENYTRYIARTIYPESPDKEEILQFTLAAAATQKSGSGLCEVRFIDKGAKEWVCVFASTTDKEMKEKYFKRDLEGFLKLFIEDTLLLVPYPDKIADSQESLDAICKKSFGCGFNELPAWIGKQMNFIMKKIIPAKKGPTEILEYYDIVKDYK